MSTWSTGSGWIRIDPHLHVPGTLRANQYGNHEDPATWDEYVKRLRAATPPAAVLGITDYFVPRGYRFFRDRVRLTDVPGLVLVFPNIELRLNIKTDRGHAVNVHLLVSPNEPDHLDVISAKLQSLEFPYGRETFRCTEDDLKRLGRAHERNASLDDETALRKGAGQFLVESGNFADLKKDAWIERNVLFAVAAGNDGLGGLSKDSAFHAHREELATIADVIFSGQPNDRKFWLGDHPDFKKRGYLRKPCVHGSDAHTFEDILRPDEERMCWIRAEPTFDGLRQILVEPERRVHIGKEAPAAPSPSEVIRHVRFTGASWINPLDLALNDGLITVIGPRGSGKTALADLMALAADASDPEPGPASFVRRAAIYLGDVVVELEWGDGTTEQRRLDDPDGPLEPRVRYLSQQFVERLSSRGDLEDRKSDNWTAYDEDEDTTVSSVDDLLSEIERVVFDAVPEENRLMCSTFRELREVTLRGHIADRSANQESIRKRTATVAEEQELHRSLASFKAKHLATVRERAAIEKDLKSLPVRAGDQLIKAYETAAAKLKRLQDAIAAENLKTQQYDEIARSFARHLKDASEAHAIMRAKFGNLLTTAEWESLRLRPAADSTGLVEVRARASREAAKRLRENGDPHLQGASATAGLIRLTAEFEAAKKALGDDQVRMKRRADLEKKLGTAKQLEEQAKKRVAHAEGAAGRIKDAQAERLNAYEEVFDTLAGEAQALEGLYGPLRERLAADSRLDTLSFYVYRHVDLRNWVDRGAALLDFRKPPFQGRESLYEAARTILQPAWQKGTAAESRDAMRDFLTKYGAPALTALATGVTPLHFGQWLFSTDHIRVRYGIRYEDVDLANLSPGARGVVLLTLYLAIDEEDTRPLIIDQPEENLDPKSVYTALVPFFRDAARRRQIIMVTHNANLVVNTDSDQVIVAEAIRTSPTELPKIAYSAGGLEDERIRELVCQYLEGGREAFTLRGKRYGVVRAV